jgi:hypothetical protein
VGIRINSEWRTVITPAARIDRNLGRKCKNRPPRTTQFIGAAAKGSLFTGHELLAMIDRFPRDWSESDLWELLLRAVDGKELTKTKLRVLPVVNDQRTAVRWKLQCLGKAQRELAKLTGLSRGTLERSPRRARGGGVFN